MKFIFILLTDMKELNKLNTKLDVACITCFFQLLVYIYLTIFTQNVVALFSTDYEVPCLYVKTLDLY